MLKQALTTVALVALSAPAFAGGLAAPVEAPVVAVPVAPVVQPSADWTGFYAGLQGGRASADASILGDPVGELEGTYYGLHAGYLHDLGRFVVGGELRYDDASDIEIASPAIGGKSLIAASLRAGYDMGRLLPYASVGFGQFTAADDDKSNGMLYGIGADYALTDRWRLGVEAMHFDFDSFSDSDYEVSGNAVGLRASFSF